MNMEVSLAEILGIENEYDLLNKQAKVCKEAMALTDKHHDIILLNPAIMHHRTGKLQIINQKISRMRQQSITGLYLSVVWPFTLMVCLTKLRAVK